MINNINSYNSLVNTSSTSTSTSEIDSIIAQHKESTAEQTATVATDQSSLYLSSRAQKINALSKEFFSGDTLKFDDVESLKERVYQLGLISKDEYGKLTNTSSDIDTSSLSNENSSLGLTQYMGDLITRLQSDDNNETSDAESEAQRSETLSILIKALESAKEVISNVEEAKRETDFKASLQATLATLKDTIEDPAFEKIPLDDKVGLTKVYQTLEIVDQLSPQRLNNDRLNKYIDLSFS
ncbi:hypothetical protein FGD67_01020 [Colwellia sp. M166]|uniref:hypothetical protein n=1 Tax=Colwellia sp. M166 TaxID=2583805 RepID=UPI00211E60D0|nr:hypothetical protein [Colwellia sp. M166]UUO21937.1 hypothetical protein FGD67_01020 [Colwellia sp. M166]|tara:strand:- start:2089 stop:2808 length:720 start_codon:yes stop_codon:yes gene_type:complete